MPNINEINVTLTFRVSDTMAPKVYGGRAVKATQVEFGPVSVTRHNRAEAKQEAARIVQAWMGAWRFPTVLRFKAHSATLLSMPTDNRGHVGTYEIYQGVGSDGAFYVHTSASSHESWEAARVHARYRMVDMWVDWHDDEQVREACTFLDEGDRTGESSTTLRQYAGFQRAHKVARDAGHTDPHTFACENERKYTPAAA